MALGVGDQAPALRGIFQDGSEVKDANFRGKPLLLYFYPKDNTKGCTDEACSLRDGYELLRNKGVEVIGVSADSAKSHQGFIAKYGLPFLLIADTNQELANAYGAWVEKSRCGKTYMGMQRISYLIAPDGKIAHVFDKVKTSAHAEQVLEVVAQLGW